MEGRGTEVKAHPLVVSARPGSRHFAARKLRGELRGEAVARPHLQAA